jgi:hypothetical protein
VFIPGKDYAKARAQAQANANASGVPWVVFTDTSGNLHVERDWPTRSNDGETFAPHNPCEVCGRSRGTAGCTNQRCKDCHAKHCTAGGSTYPGHGRGTVATPFQRTQPKGKKV